MADFHRHTITRLRYEHKLGYKAIRKLYAQMYPGERVPATTTIRNIIEKAEELDTYEDLRHYNRGNIKEQQHFAVVQAVIEQPTISMRQIEALHNVPKSSAVNILKRYGFKSYKCHDLKHIKRPDLIDSDDHLHFLAADEASPAKKPRKPNKQNDRIWALENPRLLRKLPTLKKPNPSSDVNSVSPKASSHCIENIEISDSDSE